MQSPTPSSLAAGFPAPSPTVPSTSGTTSLISSMVRMCQKCTIDLDENTADSVKAIITICMKSVDRKKLLASVTNNRLFVDWTQVEGIPLEVSAVEEGALEQGGAEGGLSSGSCSSHSSDSEGNTSSQYSGPTGRRQQRGAQTAAGSSAAEGGGDDNLPYFLSGSYAADAMFDAEVNMLGGWDMWLRFVTTFVQFDTHTSMPEMTLRRTYPPLWHIYKAIKDAKFLETELPYTSSAAGSGTAPQQAGGGGLGSAVWEHRGVGGQAGGQRALSAGAGTKEGMSSSKLCFDDVCKLCILNNIKGLKGSIVTKEYAVMRLLKGQQAVADSIVSSLADQRSSPEIYFQTVQYLMGIMRVNETGLKVIPFFTSPLPPPCLTDPRSLLLTDSTRAARRPRSGTTGNAYSPGRRPGLSST